MPERNKHPTLSDGYFFSVYEKKIKKLLLVVDNSAEIAQKRPVPQPSPGHGGPEPAGY